jgi:hypothetical protein
LRSLLVARVVIAVLVSISALVGGGLAYAQDIIGGTGRQELTRPTTRAPKPKPVYVTHTRTVYIDRNAHPTITTGTLSVATLTNATILVEPVKGGTGKETTVPVNESQFIFGDLKPGTYRVAATLEGYKPDEKNVEIVANKTNGVSLSLKPILYTVTISTNVASGEVRYASVEAYIDAGTGEKKYKPTGETRLALIQNGTAILPALRKGTYGVDIRANEVGYDPLLGSVTVPDNTNREEVRLDVALNNVRSTDTFSALTSDQWDLPAGWRIASYLLSANGKGVAIPHLESYRHYTDLELISDAKMLNGVAVSFLAHASADKQNYYLIQLTGPNAEEPYLLSGFIVKHGVRERFQSIAISHLSATIKPNQFFKILIKLKDNSIDVSVRDSQTGDYFPLGVLTDSNRNFPIGAPGIAAGDKDQSQFGTFMVCAPECPRQ